MKEKTFLDRFMASVIFASPVVYIALVIMEIAGIPAVSALGGMVFFGGLMVGSALVGAAAAMIRVSVKR